MRRLQESIRADNFQRKTWCLSDFQRKISQWQKHSSCEHTKEISYSRLVIKHWKVIKTIILLVYTTTSIYYKINYTKNKLHMLWSFLIWMHPIQSFGLRSMFVFSIKYAKHRAGKNRDEKENRKIGRECWQNKWLYQNHTFLKKQYFCNEISTQGSLLVYAFFHFPLVRALNKQDILTLNDRKHLTIIQKKRMQQESRGLKEIYTQEKLGESLSFENTCYSH